MTGEVNFLLSKRPHTVHHNNDGAYLYRLLGDDGEVLYVGCTVALARRLREHSKTKPWWSLVSGVEIQPYETWLDALIAEGAEIRSSLPRFNLAAGLVAPREWAFRDHSQPLSNGECEADRCWCHHSHAWQQAAS